MGNELLNSGTPLIRSYIPRFGGIHLHDAVTAQAIPNGTTYTKLTLFTDNGLSKNCTPDFTNNKITLTKTGVYIVNGTFSMLSDTNNIECIFSAFLDGVEQDQIHTERKISTGADLGAASFCGFINVDSVPVDLDVRVRHDYISPVNLTLTYANFNAHAISEAQI